ncbi:hypothetical protein HDU83_000205 [Entophlyctis luteolus]|nr:hypothetical protein HDU83_000205 [Entophlyctis luteolus]
MVSGRAALFRVLALASALALSSVAADLQLQLPGCYSAPAAGSITFGLASCALLCYGFNFAAINADFTCYCTDVFSDFNMTSASCSGSCVDLLDWTSTCGISGDALSFSVFQLESNALAKTTTATSKTTSTATTPTESATITTSTTTFTTTKSTATFSTTAATAEGSGNNPAIWASDPIVADATTASAEYVVIAKATSITSNSVVTTQSATSVVQFSSSVAPPTSVSTGSAFTVPNGQSSETNLEVANGSSVPASGGTNVSGTLATVIALLLVVAGAVVWRRRLWGFWRSRRFWKQTDDPTTLLAGAIENRRLGSKLADKVEQNAFKAPEKSKRYLPQWRATSRAEPVATVGSGFFAHAESRPVAKNAGMTGTALSVSTGSVVVMGSTVERLYKDVAASQLRSMMQSRRVGVSLSGAMLSGVCSPPPSNTDSASIEALPPSPSAATRSSTVSSTGSSDETFRILRGPAYKHRPAYVPNRTSNPGSSEISFKIVPNVEGRKLGHVAVRSAAAGVTGAGSGRIGPVSELSSPGFTDASFLISPTYIAPAFVPRALPSNSASHESSAGMSEISFLIFPNPAFKESVTKVLEKADKTHSSTRTSELSFRIAVNPLASGAKQNVMRIGVSAETALGLME